MLINDRIKWTIIVLTVSCLSIEAQILKKISLDEAVNVLSLKSPSVKTVIIDYENKVLEFDSYKKSFLPSISLSLTPFNLNRSINLLQNPSDGTYRYVEDYLGNTSAGLSLSQRIGITGGNLTINTNQNLVNEFSNSRRTFNSVPFSISYSQSLFGGNKKYKYEKEINYKENSISKLNYCLEILKVQEQISTYYISTYTAMLEEEMAINSFEQSDSLLSIAKIKLDNDNITQHEFDLIKIKKSESEYQLKEAKIKHKNHLKKLLFFLGLPTNNLQGYKLFKPNISLPDNLDRDVVYLFVNRNNPFSLAQEIKKAKIKLYLFNKKLKNSFNSSVSISYGSNQFSNNFLDSYRNPNSRQSVSLSMSIPIFKWGISKNTLKIAQNEYQKRLITLKNEEIKFNNDLDEKVAAYNSAMYLYSLTEKENEIYKAHYKLALKTFLLNKSSIYDLYALKKEQQNTMQKHLKALESVWNKYFEIRTISLYDFIGNNELIPITIANTNINNNANRN